MKVGILNGSDNSETGENSGETSRQVRDPERIGGGKYK